MVLNFRRSPKKRNSILHISHILSHILHVKINFKTSESAKIAQKVTNINALTQGLNSFDKTFLKQQYVECSLLFKSYSYEKHYRDQNFFRYQKLIVPSCLRLNDDHKISCV